MTRNHKLFTIVPSVLIGGLLFSGALGYDATLRSGAVSHALTAGAKGTF